MASCQDEEAVWTRFAERPEWQDFVVTRMQRSAANVVSIQYSPQHEETLAYFYTALESREISLRILHLTEEVRPTTVTGIQSSAWSVVWQF